MKRGYTLLFVVATAGLAAWLLAGRPSASPDTERRARANGPSTPSTPPDRRVDRDDASGSEHGDSTVDAESDAAHDDSAGSAPRRGVVLAASEELASEDRDHARWDALSRDERVASLEHAFARAMAEARAGGSTAATARSRAESTLSTLRAELWPTPEGRARYLRFETAIDDLAEPDDAKRGAQ